MGDDSRQIWVGEDKINIRGLKEVIEEIARSHAEKTDGEIEGALLEKLSEKNYIGRARLKNIVRHSLGNLENSWANRTKKHWEKAIESAPDAKGLDTDVK